MPFKDCSIWIHIVFSTKNRTQFLSWEIRNEICLWIKQQASLKGIHVDIVNGKKDHLHVLIKMHSTQTVAGITKWIKGASSRYLNQKYTWNPKFEWQRGYGAYSVSKDDIKRVRKYIYDQERRHE